MNSALIFPELPYFLGMSRKPYPSDVSDEEWDFVAPQIK